MKRFIVIIMMLSSAFSAKIDTQLFLGENIPKHLSSIEQSLQNPIEQKLKSKETIALEKSTLQKLKELYGVKDKIKPFATIPLDTLSIPEQRYLQALIKLTALQSEISRLTRKKRDIQQKLFELKSTIEKSLPHDNNNSLLNNQLQYAFYKISQEKILASLALYKPLFSKEFSKFQEALSRVNFKAKVAKKIIKHTDKKIDSIKNKNMLLTIDKDSEAQQDNNAKKQINAKEKNIQKETDQALIQKTKAQILLSLQCLQHKDQKAFLEVGKQIKEGLKSLSKEEKSYYTTMWELILQFSDKRFDDASLSLASTKIGFDDIKKSAIMIANKTLFVYEDKAFSIKTILTFVLIIMIGIITAKIYKNIINKFRQKNRIKSLSTARLIANSGYYLIILITFFTALLTIGLDVHTIFLVIGAILLWLALGLQGFISNYAMGILIKIDRSIRIGDYIELDEKISGIVDDMNFRAITIQTSDQVRYTIPNSRFISSEFINHSLEDNIRRLEIPFSADKSLMLETLQETILEALKQSDIAYLNTTQHPSKVVILDLNRKITRYALLVWIKQHNDHDTTVVKSAFLNIIQKSLSHLQNYDTITTQNIKEKNYD